MIRVRLGEFVCIHRQDQWKEEAEKNGIDMSREYGFYRDAKTNEWIIFQENDYIVIQ